MQYRTLLNVDSTLTCNSHAFKITSGWINNLTNDMLYSHFLICCDDLLNVRSEALYKDWFGSQMSSKYSINSSDFCVVSVFSFILKWVYYTQGALVFMRQWSFLQITLSACGIVSLNAAVENNKVIKFIEDHWFLLQV